MLEPVQPATINLIIIVTTVTILSPVLEERARLSKLDLERLVVLLQLAQWELTILASQAHKDITELELV